MKRSALVDGLLLAAVLLSTMSLFAFLREIPGECPAPSPSSVEELFAPCLAASREDFERPAIAPVDDPRLAPLPPRAPVAADRSRIGPRPNLDVETTGSTGQAARRPQDL
jgi:hypothetical protein